LSNGFRPVRAALAAVLLSTAVAGCGAGRGEVTGIVTLDGKPLPFGTIQFLGPDGIPCAGAIGPDGSFSVQVPVGEARVLIVCLDEAQVRQVGSQLAAARGRAAPPPPVSGPFSLIPQRYGDWTTSGLTISVTRGTNLQDFFLTSR
jgi:hypothetical protein